MNIEQELRQLIMKYYNFGMNNTYIGDIREQMEMDIKRFIHDKPTRTRQANYKQ
jgi:hypothetical protein